MVSLTPTEEAFLTMFKLVAPTAAVFYGPNDWSLTFVDEPSGQNVVKYTGREWNSAPVGWIADMIPKLVEARPFAFPILASTFDALTIERPELRNHYERAKAALEATQ